MMCWRGLLSGAGKMAGMKRWPTFTLRYLLVLVFWWAVAFALIREVVDPYGPPESKRFFYLFLPLALGPAYGGLVLKMRFGFIAGFWIWLLLVLFFLQGARE
jgi:hypothetical protein